jgi:hypothetical protein
LSSFYTKNFGYIASVSNCPPAAFFEGDRIKIIETERVCLALFFLSFNRSKPVLPGPSQTAECTGGIILPPGLSPQSFVSVRHIDRFLLQFEGYFGQIKYLFGGQNHRTR